MKNKFPSIALAVKRGKLYHLVLLLLLLVTSPKAMSSAILDHQYSLDTIGILKPSDNVDGLFADITFKAFHDYFKKQSRFALNDLSQADAILEKSKIKYSKLIFDRDILQKVCLSSHTQALVRTQVWQRGSKYYFNFDLLHAPKMEKVSSEEFNIDELPPGGSFEGQELQKIIEIHIERLFSHIPYLGKVTGRDTNQVTVNLGRLSQLKERDVLVLGTVEEVRIHPLLNTILEWRIVPTGKVIVENVEEGMAFCKVVQEDLNKVIGKYQKIIQIQPAMNEREMSQRPAMEEQKREPAFIPQLGSLGMSLAAGPYSRQFNTYTASSLSLGGGLEGELWLTKRWFSELNLGYSYWVLSQKDSTTGQLTPNSQNASSSSSYTLFKYTIGYAFLTTDRFFGPRAWIKAGYKSTSYSMPTSLVELTGPLSIKSFFIGLGGRHPLGEQWGAMIDLDFKLLGSADNFTWLNDISTGTSDVDFFLGGYYHLSPRMTARFGLQLMAQSVDFQSSGSLSQKSVTIAPSLLYYF